jgi:hypothetical protein
MERSRQNIERLKLSVNLPKNIYKMFASLPKRPSTQIKDTKNHRNLLHNTLKRIEIILY